MQFFTKVPIAETKNLISYQSKIVSIGSCFAENIGQKFDFFKFESITNPFGITFNPISIEKLIRRAISKDYFTENDVFFHNERWNCFELHSDLSHSDQHVFLKQVNEALSEFHEKIASTSHFIITLGTSWIYKNLKNAQFVANCHKVPQSEFSKHLKSSSEILESLQNSIDLVKTINQNCHFIFTISPVRHLKDGFTENQVSKSNLITAVYQLVQDHKNSHVSYFPSFEIMMDELRDYRFYSKDLLHPNTTATDYIWSRFVETNIEKSALTTMKEVESIQNALRHRPFNADSMAHRKFLQNLNEKIYQLQEIHPFLNFKN